jgi:hypothetical protein
MKELSAGGALAVAEIAQRHGFSVDATRHMLDAVIRGDGSMAHFNHPEFDGIGQWVRGGATMVSSMVEHDLRGWIDALCLDLANLVAEEPRLFVHFAGASGRASLSVPGEQGLRVPRSGDWWPGGMGHPNSAGSQGGLRYAYFARAHRLAVERDGVMTLHDTSGHEISGVALQPSVGGALRFSSRHGPIDLADLPVVNGPLAATGD